MAEDTLTAPAYVAKLLAALAVAFPGAQIDAEHVRAERYRFVVVWDGFDAMEHAERQHRVWKLADDVLNEEELLAVTMILTLGPDELARD